MARQGLFSYMLIIPLCPWRAGQAPGTPSPPPKAGILRAHGGMPPAAPAARPKRAAPKHGWNRSAARDRAGPNRAKYRPDHTACAHRSHYCPCRYAARAVPPWSRTRLLARRRNYTSFKPPLAGSSLQPQAVILRPRHNLRHLSASSQEGQVQIPIANGKNPLTLALPWNGDR